MLVTLDSKKSITSEKLCPQMQASGIIILTGKMNVMLMTSKSAKIDPYGTPKRIFRK